MAKIDETKQETVAEEKTRSTTGKRVATRKTASNGATKKVAKKAVTRKAAPKKKVARKGAARSSPHPVSLTLEDLRHMIATAAYYKAEARGFQPGHEQRDWLDAEAEMNALLSGD